MNKTRSTLPDKPFFIHLVVFLDLVIVLVILSLGSSKVGLMSGIDVQLPTTQFILSQSRNASVLSVGAGDHPMIYFDNEPLKSLSHLESFLDKLVLDNERDNKSPAFIVLRLDKTVSRGLEQQLMEMIIKRGMHCALSAEPL